MTIIGFLEARIAEDEAEARSASPERLLAISKEGRRVINDAGFMQRFTPARVLAECAAKRAIIEQRQSYAKEAAGSVGIAFIGARGGQEVAGDVLKLLAAVYADHPDYQQEWVL